MENKNEGYPKDKRILWYRAVDRDKREVKEVCQIFDISRKTYYKWRKRDFRGGGNTVHSSLKRNTKLTWEIKQFITKEKQKTNYGPLKMKLLVKKQFHLDVSTTIIYRFYLRRRLIRKPQRKQPWYVPIQRKLVLTKPGEGVQMDVKYVYEEGIRRYQFSVKDVFTGTYFFCIFETKESKHAISAFKKAERYFGFQILSLQTDNGSEFRGVFHTWLEKKHIPLCVFKTKEDWLHYYNFERLHLTFNGLTPHEKYLVLPLTVNYTQSCYDIKNLFPRRFRWNVRAKRCASSFARSISFSKRTAILFSPTK